MSWMTQACLVAAGGAVGAVMRWGVGAMATRWWGVGFPWGTLIVNLLGCLLIGFLSHLLAIRLAWRDAAHFMVIVGFLGAFTTFSTFGHEQVNLWKQGQAFTAAGHLMAHNLLGISMVLLGSFAAQRWA